MTHPLFEQGTIRGLHNLEAGRHGFIDPARNVRESFGGKATVLPEPLIHGSRLAISEVFNNHKQGHVVSPLR